MVVLTPTLCWPFPSRRETFRLTRVCSDWRSPCFSHLFTGPNSPLFKDETWFGYITDWLKRTANGDESRGGKLSKLPIKNILILDEHLHWEAGQQQLRSFCTIISCQNQSRNNSFSCNSHHEDPHVSVWKNYKANNVKGENIEIWRKKNFFLSFYVQLRRLKICHLFVPH